MRLDKDYTATFNVRDPDDYCASPVKVAFDRLRHEFVGRCYQGAFILEILDIRRLGPCLLRDTCLSAQGYVHVEFRARVSVRDQWDILSGVRLSVTAPLIVGRSEAEGVPTSVTLVPGPTTRPLAEGLTVAVRLIAQQYPPLQEEVTAIGTLLTCDAKAPAFLCSGALSRADGDALEPMAARARGLLARRAELARGRAQDLLFFEGLLYAYRLPSPEDLALVPGPPAPGEADAPPWTGPPGVPLPAPAQAQDLLALVQRARAAPPEASGPDVSGLWCRDLALYRSSPLAAWVRPGAQPPEAWEPPEVSPPRAVFGVMLRSCCEYLQAAHDFLEAFPGADDLDRHRAVWAAMRAAQRVPGPAA